MYAGANVQLFDKVENFILFLIQILLDWVNLQSNSIK